MTYTKSRSNPNSFYLHSLVLLFGDAWNKFVEGSGVFNIIAIVIIVGILVVVGYYYYHKGHKKSSSSNTKKRGQVSSITPNLSLTIMIININLI
jgi:multidrug resistance efflux pump